MKITVQGDLYLSADLTQFASQIEEIRQNQVVLIKQGKILMGKQEDLQVEVTKLSGKLSDLNTTIPAYIAERDRIEAELRAGTTAAITAAVDAALATDAVADATTEAEAQALRDAVTDQITAAIADANAKADTAKTALTPPVVTPGGGEDPGTVTTI